MADPDRGVMGSFVRIEDGDGVLLPGTPGGPATLGLVNFGVEDGQEAVPSVRPELGTFTHPRAKKGPVKVALVSDPLAASEIDALAKQIISLVDGFKSEMETALLPWMTAWNRQGLLSIPAAYRTGKMKGFNAWWEGEVGFWASSGTGFHPRSMRRPRPCYTPPVNFGTGMSISPGMTGSILLAPMPVRLSKLYLKMQKISGNSATRSWPW